MILGLINGNSSVFWKFIALGGDKYILNSMKSFNYKLKIKGTTLLYSTCSMSSDIASKLFI